MAKLGSFLVFLAEMGMGRDGGASEAEGWWERLGEVTRSLCARLIWNWANGWREYDRRWRNGNGGKVLTGSVQMGRRRSGMVRVACGSPSSFNPVQVR